MHGGRKSRTITFFNISVLIILVLLLTVAETWSADPPPIPETRNKHLVRPISLNRRGFIGPGRSCPGEEIAVGFRMRMQPRVDHDNTVQSASS
jgi:hypothetical protein